MISTSTPLRLLSLNTYHYRRGGSDVVYFEHDALFRNMGWETASFAMHHPRNEPSPWSSFFVNELEFGTAYSNVQKLAMAGKVIYSLEARRKLRKLISLWRPDIAHAHCIYHHLSPAVLDELRSHGIPSVMTAHDLKIACPAYKMLNHSGICERCKEGNLTHVILNRCIYNSFSVSALVFLESSIHRLLGLYKKNLDRIVVPSLFFRDKLIEWGWSVDKLCYIPNFIQANSYQTETKPGNYFLYFGRLAPEKGLDTLIYAALASGITLRIVGTGPSETELKCLANSERIEFLGYYVGDKLRELIRGARAIVLPSQWYENAPMSILESYASGKIVIGARIGGIPEMVQENETGFLFESRNTDELTDILKRINLANDHELKGMGQLAREYVCLNFSPTRYIENMLNLYRSLGITSNRAPQWTRIS